MIRCIECHKEAEYIVGGSSCCKFHFDVAVQDLEKEDVI